MMLFCPATGRECQSSGCTSVMKSCDYWPKAVPTNDRYAEGFKAGREAGMREAANIVHSREMAKEIAMQVRPYEPISAENVALLMEDCHDACVAIHLAILAAIGEKHD